MLVYHYRIWTKQISGPGLVKFILIYFNSIVNNQFLFIICKSPSKSVPGTNQY